MITAVGVVIPAHDEERLLPRCLRSVRAAAAHPALQGIAVHVIPVLDACSDDTGAVAPGAIEIAARNVGMARAAGFEAGLASHRSVAGTVRVRDWSPQPAATRRHFARTYGTPPGGHLHVHGANLGLTAAAYLDAGGMPALTTGEDQALVDTLRARDHRVVATGRIPVVTSARRESRTTGGFADHLRDLSA